MLQFLQYYGKFQSVRGNLVGLPVWARAMVLLFALPGIVLLVLSVLAFFVSLATLLLLTVPVYRAMQALNGLGRGRTDEEVAFNVSDVVAGHSPRRQVDVRIVE